MDRSFKGKDVVTVFQSSRDEKRVTTIRQAPYSFFGFDNYIYKEVMYKGFQHDGMVYILLDEPLFKAPT